MRVRVCVCVCVYVRGVRGCVWVRVGARVCLIWRKSSNRIHRQTRTVSLSRLEWGRRDEGFSCRQRRTPGITAPRPTRYLSGQGPRKETASSFILKMEKNGGKYQHDDGDGVSNVERVGGKRGRSGARGTFRGARSRTEEKNRREQSLFSAEYMDYSDKETSRYVQIKWWIGIKCTISDIYFDYFDLTTPMLFRYNNCHLIATQTWLERGFRYRTGYTFMQSMNNLQTPADFPRCSLTLKQSVRIINVHIKYSVSQFQSLFE